SSVQPHRPRWLSLPANVVVAQQFDLTFDSGTSMLRMPSGAAVWDVFVGGYRPTKTLINSLDLERAAGLKRNFIAIHDQYRTPMGWRCRATMW
ncbi:MAG: hypothetical protein COW55_14120, partial [Rhodobacteraceae bacterium CG17_big_fil_post_rev_8_21_14_2_50_65_11]